ncbi:hypothetical protein EDB83DRAFT_2397045 [Lactarius deliciosus]|nr:hypothetical protein EDB83DRAFT_2397045 [Lactarius deliciosus]
MSANPTYQRLIALIAPGITVLGFFGLLMELAPLGAEAVNRLLDKGLAENISQVYLYLGSFVTTSGIRDSTGVIHHCPIGQPTPLYLMAIMTR